MKKIITTIALACSFTLSSYADVKKHSPRVSAIMDWEIGGAAIATAPTQVNNIPILDVGVQWNANLECGNFDINASISNQLNGVTEGFRQALQNIVQAATGAIASLPALAIQRASPELYDMLQQGILQGKLDFASAELSCEDMQAVMMGEKAFPWEEYKLTAEAKAWDNEVRGSWGADAIATKNRVTAAPSENAGVEWACGDMRGGNFQDPIRSINDIVIAGYNTLFNRNDKCDISGMPTSNSGTPLYDYWASPQQAADFTVEVVGDEEVRMCDGCKKMEGKPGRGLTYKHEDLANTMTGTLRQIVNGNLAVDWNNLKQVSAPPAVKVTPALIYSIREKSSAGRDAMTMKIANEIAYIRLVEQGRIMIQMLRTGLKEPNISKFEGPVSTAKQAIKDIESEMDILQKEMEVKKAVASNTIIKILGRDEQAIQDSKTNYNRNRTLNSVTPFGQP